MRYLVRFALPFCAMIFLACYLPESWLLLPVGIACVLAFFASLAVRRGNRRARALILAGALCGLLWFCVYTQFVITPLQRLDGQTTAFSAEVMTYPAETSSGVSVRVRMTSGTAEGKRALLYLDESSVDLTPGSQITGTVRFFCSVGESGVEDEYTVSSGIFLRGNAELTACVTSMGTPLRYLPEWVQIHIRQASQNLLNGPESALLCGLLMGDRSGLAEVTETWFRRAGMAHLLAVSGLHVGFLTSMLYFIPGNRSRRTLVVIPLLFLFAWITGGQPSVWRAVIMMALCQLAPLLGRENDPPTSLSAALLAMLVQNPYAALSAGLQLSFAAVTGLMLFQPRLYRRLMRPWRGRSARGLLRPVRQIYRFGAVSIATSASAIVLTLPLAARYFGLFSLVSIPAGLLTVEVASVSFAIGLAACALWWAAPALASVLVFPLKYLLRFLLWTAETFGKWRWSAVRIDNFYTSAWFAFAILVFILLLCSASLRRRPLIPVGTVVVLFLLAQILRGFSIAAPDCAVTVLDVGQGSCSVIASDGCYAAVDCGGSGSGDLLADFLYAGGADSLSLLVLTQYDADSADGVLELMYRIPVEQLLLPVLTDDNGRTAEVEALAREKGTRLQWINGTMIQKIGDVTLTVMPPVESSAAVLVQWEGSSALITGDMTGEEEAQLCEQYDLPALKLLVSGAHGAASAVSERLLSITVPAVVTLSVGENYSYLPSDIVLQRLLDYGCMICRTDRNGNITIRF